MDLTIEGKTYLNGEFYRCCIGINDGKIVSIKKILKGDKHLRFKKDLIIPSGIDLHCHFREPGMTNKEDFSTGSLSALFGGVTCFFDMPNTSPPTINLESLLKKVTLASEKSYVDFGINVAITNENYKDYIKLARICSGFKIFLGSTTNKLLLNSEKLEETFFYLNMQDKPIFIHAEDNNCLIKNKKEENNLIDHLRNRPFECEIKAIKKIINATRKTGCNIHICHLSSKEGLNILKDKPENISFGITPHHLLFCIDKKFENESFYKVNPPIRKRSDKMALMNFLRKGDKGILESDHAPHTIEDKKINFNEAPSGIPGIETVYPIFLYLAKKGKITYQRIISMYCERPAEIVSIPKGRIEIGRDADFIVIDYRKDVKIKTEMLHSKCGWSPFEGWNAIFPQYVFCRGKKLIDKGEIQVNKGFGEFIGGY
jgi:dihydroorotase